MIYLHQKSPNSPLLVFEPPGSSPVGLQMHATANPWHAAPCDRIVILHSQKGQQILFTQQRVFV